nr:hypothetical protein Itr_chr08CG05890 [Ipomoea trifida]
MGLFSPILLIHFIMFSFDISRSCFLHVELVGAERRFPSIFHLIFKFSLHKGAFSSQSQLCMRESRRVVSYYVSADGNIIFQS